ncbi:MAG: helix-turn-helix domain-containing protein [Candidatus Omnitrophota bacterium]
MPYQVLLIDDDRYFRSEFKEYLDEFKILEASNGLQAVNILKKPNQIDLIILDEMLPTKRGTELLPEIREAAPETSIIMLTGHGSKEVVIDALRGQAVDFIEKPLTPRKLEEIRSRILSVPRGQNDSSVSGVKGKIERAKYFAERNFDKHLTLEDVANEVCLSPKYLSRIFKESMGISFTDYKLQIRIQRAKELLSTTGDNIEEISYKLGYQNPESFCKVFREFTQLTPREFREKERLKKLSRSSDKTASDVGVSERQAEMARKILAFTTDAIIEFNSRGRITFWSQGAEKLYGWTAKKMIPRSIFDINAGGDIEELKAFIRQSEFTEAERIFKITRLKKDGGSLEVFTRIVPQLNDRGKCKGFLCFERETAIPFSSVPALSRPWDSAVDVTDSAIHTDGEVSPDHGKDIIGRFSSIIAHEMRRPFSSIQMAAWNIKRKSPKGIEENIKTIEKMVEEGERIIKHLLNYSIILPPQYHQYSIKSLVSECVDEAQHSCENLFVDLVFDLEKTSDADIETDKDHFKQILSSILKNAFDAVADESAGKVKVAARIDEDHLIIDIVDNGQGIAAEDMNKIYQPFFSKKHQGIGLGLTICDQMLKLHKGKLEINGNPGKGVKASVTLPLKQ